MRETKFIEQNREDWEALERTLGSSRPDPDRLVDLFVKTTDNLSYSRTFYPNRSVRVYLNGLAQRIFANVYRSKQSNRQKLIRFWTEELPDILWDSRRELLVALSIFLLAIGMGVLSSIYEPEFARSILGDEYVDMTIGNIDAGDPMNVYKDRNIIGMWLGITFNNILVALKTFAMGIVFAIGTIFILVSNGVMVGAFQYFFVEYGLFQESFLTIFMHGAAELSAIAIAGGAGLTMGRGLVFPGTHSRYKAFQLSARRGIKIMLAVVVMLVFAGFVEAFVTRLTEVPNVVRAAFIFSCFGFIIYYFAVYPWYRHRYGLSQKRRDERIPVGRDYRVNYQSIKSAGTIITETLLLWQRDVVRFLPWVAVLAALHTAVIYVSATDVLSAAVGQLNTSTGFFNLIPAVFDGWLPLFSGGLAFSLLAARVLNGSLSPLDIADTDRKFWMRRTPILLIAGMSLSAVLSLRGDAIFLVIAPAVLPILLILIAGVYRSTNPFSALANGLGSWRSHFGGYLSVTLLLFILVFSAFVLLSSGFVGELAQFIVAMFRLEEATMITGVGTVLTYLMTFLLYLAFPCWLFAAKLLHYSAREKRDANGLHDYIGQIGAERRIRGMLRE